MKLHVFLSNAVDVLGPLAVEIDRRWGPVTVSGSASHPEIEATFRQLPLNVERVVPLWEIIGAAESAARVGQTVSESELARDVERITSSYTAWELIAADWRFVSKWTGERAKLTLAGMVTAVEELFDDVAPDVLLMDSVACIASFVHLLVARQRGVPVASFGGARVPGRFTISSDEFERPQKLGQYLATGAPDWARQDAELLLDDYLARSIRGLTHLDSPLYTSNPGLTRNDVREFLKLLRLSRGAPSDYFTYGSPFTAVLSRTRRIARSRLQKRFFESATTDNSSPYALYCLHFEPEASTHVKGMRNRDQAALIERIALSLPSTTRLVVKEHPVSIGRRPSSFYRRLAANPNISLATPTSDSLLLAAGSSVVYALTGTIGFEAYLMGRPVVVLGNCFYDAFPGVSKVSEPAQVNVHTIRSASMTERKNSLAAYLASTYQGMFAPGWFFPEAKTEANISALADAFGDWMTDRQLTSDR